MTWTLPPSLGKFGMFAFAVQTALGTPATAPTYGLRATQFMDPLQSRIWTPDPTANGTIFEAQMFEQGVKTDSRTVTVELTLAALAALLPAALGPVSSGTVTPVNADYDVLSPTQPLTVWQLHPTGGYVYQDVQIGGINITAATRTNVTAQITFNTTVATKLTALPTIAIPTDVLQFRHFYVKVDGVTYKPEQGGINLAIPMGVVDGANGLDPAAANYPQGWERNGAVSLKATFDLPFVAEVFRDAYSNGALKHVVAGFSLPQTAPAPAKVVEFDIPKAQFTSMSIPSGMDRLVMPYETTAINADLTTPFTVKLPT